MSRLQKKPAALKRGHPTLQNMIFFSFCGSFLPSWIRIRIPNTDPDPLARLNTDPDPDPDPKPWLITKNCKTLQLIKLQFFLSQPPWKTSKLQEKLSTIKKEHPALKNFTFFYFLGSFLSSGIWIQIRVEIIVDFQKNQCCGSVTFLYGSVPMT